MHILFLANHYPPAHLGGMELRCQEVVTGLQGKRHICEIITSTFTSADLDMPEQSGVHRVMSLESDVYHYHPFDHLARHAWRLQASVRAVRSLITQFEPDIVFIWGMWNLSPALAAEAERLCPGRVVYSFAGYWPIEPDVHESFWLASSEKWLGRQFRRALAPLALSSIYRPSSVDSLQFDHAIACSQFVLTKLQEGGMTLPHAKVVFSGIDVDWFVPASAPESHHPGGLRVVFIGALTRRKGVHVAIEAIRLLVEWGQVDIRLTIVGEGHPSYRDELETAVEEADLAQSVCFRPAVPRRDLPRLLEEFDTLVLPSLSDVPEPLSRTVMEGMARGLVVVGTNEGGTPEMINDGIDGLLFAPGDSAELAHRLQTIARDPELRRRLSAAARQTAEKQFRLGRMIDEIEEFLVEVMATGQRPC